MTIFSNDWGETATTQDEIIRKNVEHMDEEDLIRELNYQGIADKIIAWAVKQDAFRSEFDEFIKQAEINWAVGQGWWEEEEDGSEWCDEDPDNGWEL